MKNKDLISLLTLFAIANTLPAQSYKRQVGKINYEIKDHLGDVCLVVNDVKEYDIVTGKSTAHLLSAINYYAFGMEMPGRTYSSPAYRYGYNCMEKDNELKGNGNSYTTEFRQYDPRLGRWLSVDPLVIKHPGWTPYKSMLNNPILFIDNNGDTEYRFYVRSFESSQTFGAPVVSAGDNRTFTTKVNVTARITSAFTLEALTGAISGYKRYSSESHSYYPSLSDSPFGLGLNINETIGTCYSKGIIKSRFSDLTLNKEKDGMTSVDMEYSGAHGVTKFMGPLNPDIDVESSFLVRQTKDKLVMIGTVRGDAFPDNEAFTFDPSGQSIMLATFKHPTARTPLMSLWGKGLKPMSEFKIVVGLDEKGNFKKAQKCDFNYETSSATNCSDIPIIPARPGGDIEPSIPANGEKGWWDKVTEKK